MKPKREPKRPYVSPAKIAMGSDLIGAFSRLTSEVGLMAEELYSNDTIIYSFAKKVSKEIRDFYQVLADILGKEAVLEAIRDEELRKEIESLLENRAALAKAREKLNREKAPV